MNFLFDRQRQSRWSSQVHVCDAVVGDEVRVNAGSSLGGRDVSFSVRAKRAGFDRDIDGFGGLVSDRTSLGGFRRG